jgi:hypothetical protein
VSPLKPCRLVSKLKPWPLLNPLKLPLLLNQLKPWLYLRPNRFKQRFNQQQSNRSLLNLLPPNRSSLPNRRSSTSGPMTTDTPGA